MHTLLARWARNNQEALSVHLGAQTLRLVNLVLTDGDSQEMTQVAYAITSYFAIAACSCCGWHFVHQGWRQECRGLGFWKERETRTEDRIE
jgi:hypothetical protein